MTNDDKDLKPCPFCGDTKYLRVTYQDSKANASITGDKKYWGVFCMEKCGASIDSIYPTREEAIRVWNTRATPQQPSEPLKELDEKAILMVLDQCCPVSMDKMAKEMIAQILWNKFGQPSEKKALSVDSIKTILTKIMKKELVDIGEHFCFVCGEPMSEEKRGLLIDYIAQAIHSALPAQREVRYPDTAYVDKNDGKPGRIEKINYCLGWNHCIDEFKKLNGG